MAGTAQKDEERFYLDRFLTRIGRSPLEVRDAEGGVDHYVLTTDGRLGVEQVMFHAGSGQRKGSPRRALEQRTDALIDLINRKRPKCASLDDVIGFVHFKGSARPSKYEQEAFLAELLGFATKRSDALTRHAQPFRSFGAEHPFLRKYLWSIALARTGIDARWYASDVDWISTCQDDLLASVSGKLQFSRPGQIDEWWLLVVSGWRLSQGMSHFSVGDLRGSTRLEEKLQRSSYDKVLLFEYIRGRVLQWDHQDGWAEVKVAEDPSQH